MADLIRIVSSLVATVMVAVSCYCTFDTNRSIEELKEMLIHPEDEVDKISEHDEGDNPRI